MQLKTKIKRLQLMEQLLKEIARSPKLRASFDLDSWVRGVLHKNIDGDQKQLITECGTAACACGFAGLDSRFRALGFKYDLKKHGIYYRGHESWAAVRLFFGITHDQLRHLFSWSAYLNLGRSAKPSDVRARVSKLIRELQREGATA